MEHECKVCGVSFKEKESLLFHMKVHGSLKGLIKGVPKDLIKGVPKDLIKGVPKDLIKGVPKDLIKGVPKDLIKGVPKDLKPKVGKPERPRPFACHLCPKRCFTKAHLKEHMLVHIPVNEECTVCGKTVRKIRIKSHKCRQPRNGGVVIKREPKSG